MLNKTLKTAPMSVISLIAKIQKTFQKSNFLTIFSSKLICISILFLYLQCCWHIVNNRHIKKRRCSTLYPRRIESRKFKSA